MLARFAAVKTVESKLMFAPSGLLTAASSASRREQAVSVELMVIEPCGLQLPEIPASSALVFTTKFWPVTTPYAIGALVEPGANALRCVWGSNLGPGERLLAALDRAHLSRVI